MSLNTLSFYPAILISIVIPRERLSDRGNLNRSEKLILSLWDCHGLDTRVKPSQ